MFIYFRNRYKTKESATTDGVISELLIPEVEKKDMVIFTCRAANAYGSDEARILLIIQGKTLTCTTLVLMPFIKYGCKVAHFKRKITNAKSRLPPFYAACCLSCKALVP